MRSPGHLVPAPDTASAPVQPPTADNLGVQLLVQVSNWLGDVSSELAGGRLVSALLTITIAATAAVVIWEASNAAIEQHLARLTREGH